MSDFGNLRRYPDLPSRDQAHIRREVNEELQLHIQMRTEALVREGVSAADARARALSEFGDIDDASQYCEKVDTHTERRRRVKSWWSDIGQDGAHAVRLLRRAPGFAVATNLTLALALGASTAVYGVLHAYLFRPLPFPQSDRLMFVAGPSGEAGRRGPSLNEVDWAPIDSIFDSTARWDIDGFTIEGEPFAENVTGAWVSAGYFEALSLRPAIGRTFRADEFRDQSAVAIISHDLWVRRFAADTGIVGTAVTMHSVDRANGAVSVTIIGVLARDFWPIQWSQSELLRPLPHDVAGMPMLVRLAPTMDQLQAEQRLNAGVRAQLTGEIDPAWRLGLEPALARHSNGARPILTAVFGAALFMLLAACGSVAGALVSRMSARRSELGIRLALGGSRARIVRQLVTESGVLATLAGVLGIVFAYGLVVGTAPLIERLLGTSVPGGVTTLRPSALVMLSAFVASLVAGLGSGLVPVLTFLRLDRKSVATALMGAGRSGSARGGVARVRRILITTQLTVATVLMFGAGLMFQTVARMASTELGFRPDGVMRASLILPDRSYGDSAAKQVVMQNVLANIEQTSGVSGAAAVFPSPFSGAWGMAVVADGSGLDQESSPRATVYTASERYFETMEIPLRSGRVFTAGDDQQSPYVVVVSENLARRIASDGDVIGRRLRFFVPYTASFGGREDHPWRTVVGIVGDTKKEFSTNAMPELYVPYSQNPRSYLTVVARTERPVPEIVEPVRRAVTAIDPSLALFGIGSVEDDVAARGGQRRGLSVLLGSFAVFALALSALALYASLSYTVVQRQSELAVRMAVGANTRSILKLVMAEGLSTTVIGLAIGIMASLALGRVLKNQVYGVGTGDPGTLAAIAFVLGIAALVACLIPSFRALRVDPALVLRE